MLKAGTPAPGFEALDQDGNPFHLADLHGSWIVLYFYPKDETIGCTAEACTFRDQMADFRSLGAKVVGVSTQGVGSHRSFADHHSLNFTLIADEDKTVSNLYRTLGILGVNRRVTYLIDPEGKIAGVHRSEARPKGHVEWSRAQLDSMI
ncbi:MAG: peroxiredoxin [Thermoplasmata archaeon]